MHDMAQDHDTRSWWQSVRGALRGTKHDYTTGPIGRSIFLLAIPMVLEMIMESLFALSDVFFVARLGASAVATVGLTESMMIVVYTIAMGLAIAGTAVEVLKDSAMALPPLNVNLAADLVSRTRVAKLLAGYRDRAAIDRAGVRITAQATSPVRTTAPA